MKKPLWTELAYIFLSVGNREQRRFDRELKGLIRGVRKGQTPKRHNWLVLTTQAGSARRHAVVGYPYLTDTRQERNDMILHIAAEVEKAAPVLGIAVIGLDAKGASYPYDVLVYAAGHAEGSPDVERLRGGTPPPKAE